MLKSEPALNAIIVFYLVLYTYGAVDVRIDYLVSVVTTVFRVYMCRVVWLTTWYERVISCE